jgi:hypothetical protein
MAKQQELFEEDKSHLVKDFIDRHSGSFTDEVIDIVNERLTEVFNDEGFDDYDLMAEIADTMMKDIGNKLQMNPEEWV